jgi:murein DD-endopeptidase
VGYLTGSKVRAEWRQGVLCAAFVASAVLLAYFLTGCAAVRTPPKTGYLPSEPGTIVTTARSQLGAPYRYRGGSPQTGFDCSGFTRWVYLQYGVTLPRQSDDQYRMGQEIHRNQLQPGDLVFFSIDKKGASHVGIYSGSGTFVHAPRTGDRVREDDFWGDYWQDHYLGARRILP